jgi:hypothetical protein
MGKNVLPPSLLIAKEEALLKDFLRALRKEDRLVLQRLLAKARGHSQAIGLADFEPSLAILMAMILEVQKELEAFNASLAGEKGGP